MASLYAHAQPQKEALLLILSTSFTLHFPNPPSAINSLHAAASFMFPIALKETLNASSTFACVSQGSFRAEPHPMLYTITSEKLEHMLGVKEAIALQAAPARQETKAVRHYRVQDCVHGQSCRVELQHPRRTHPGWESQPSQTGTVRRCRERSRAPRARASMRASLRGNAGSLVLALYTLQRINLHQKVAKDLRKWLTKPSKYCTVGGKATGTWHLYKSS